MSLMSPLHLSATIFFSYPLSSAVLELGLELLILAVMVWCLIHYTTKLLYEKQFWNFLIKC